MLSDSAENLGDDVVGSEMRNEGHGKFRVKGVAVRNDVGFEHDQAFWPQARAER